MVRSSREPCPWCRGAGYVAREPGDTPPVRLEEGKGLGLLEAQAFANWVLWGKACPICNGSGRAHADPSAPDEEKSPAEATGFALASPVRCAACGDTGVVSRRDYPTSRPAPGFIDTMGSCPFCGQKEPLAPN